MSLKTGRIKERAQGHNSLAKRPEDQTEQQAGPGRAPLLCAVTKSHFHFDAVQGEERPVTITPHGDIYSFVSHVSNTHTLPL